MRSHVASKKWHRHRAPLCRDAPSRRAVALREGDTGPALFCVPRPASCVETIPTPFATSLLASSSNCSWECSMRQRSRFSRRGTIVNVDELIVIVDELIVIVDELIVIVDELIVNVDEPGGLPQKLLHLRSFESNLKKFSKLS